MTGRHARVVYNLDAPAGGLVSCEATAVPHPESASCVAPVAAPEACYVCGNGPHERVELHDYWSKSDAARYFAAEPSGGSYPSMSAVETLDPREAVYL